MEVKNYKSISKGCLLGKFDIEIKEWGGLTIMDCTLFQKDEKRWITLPSREYQTKDGQKKHFGLVKFSPEIFKKLESASLIQLDKFMTIPQQQPAVGDSQPLPF